MRVRDACFMKYCRDKEATFLIQENSLKKPFFVKKSKIFILIVTILPKLVFLFCK